MASYTCQTCDLTLPEMGRHLSQTRHKIVTYDALNETVECSDCGDTNIHILLMLRYGLSDFGLLCSECYKKSKELALAEYTLQNGSLLQKLPQYYTLRDIHCTKCGKDKHLSVTKGSKHTVYCRDCVKEGSLPDKDLVSEDSDDFLFALFGIKEYVAKAGNNKGRKRTTGRMGGRRGPKKDDPGAEQRRAHYQNKKATEAAYKAGKTVKAVGSATVSPGISRSVTPKPKLFSPRVDDQRSGAKKDEKAVKKDLKSADPKSSKKEEKPPKKDKETTKGQKKPEAKKDGSKVNGASKLKDEKTPRKATTNGASSSVNDNSLSAKKAEKSENPKKSAGKDKPLKKPLPEKTNRKETKEPSTSKDKTTAQFKSLPDKAVSDSTPKQQLNLPAEIFRYQTSPDPPLSYDSMTAYFQEMCYNLFLEERASLATSNYTMLSPGEFELEWYADQNKKHKQFKVNILLTPDILDRFMSKKMQSIRKNPFAVNQAVMLVLNDEIPWYGNIVLVDNESVRSGKPLKRGRGSSRGSRSSSRGGDSGPKILEMVIELYKWNTMPLPLTQNVNYLKILPVSVPVSRVFMAMSKILNPRFIDMILGKKPIRQIVFNNYLKFTRDTFNDSQKVAIQSVLNNSITVLQGPPGTGKTSTIYEIILQLLENLNTYPILVVAASNIAIDNIAEKLLEKHGNSILRIVSNEKEPEYNREHPLSSICLHHKVYDGLPQNLQQTIKDMRNPHVTVSPTLYKKLLTTQIDYSDKLIALARVIFTTTVVAGGNQLKSVPKIPVVIMDEATQSSEPTTLIPLSMPGVEKFVFVGDQKQLSSFSQVPNLSLSLFERIISNGTYRTPHMLDTQYRMHPAISEFPRRKFYDGLLKDGLTAADRAKEGIPENPVVFWDTCGKCPEGTVRSRFREDSGLTYANRGEIDYVEKVLTALIFEKGIPKSEIGVITPYRGQRDMLSSVLVKNELINPEKLEVHVEIDRDDIYNESKPVTIHTVSDIMIASIDAFQGREKDFLIMSCVRSNDKNKIGFLNDARRMNVALTRARYGLILIGDVECLSKSDALWKEYIDTLKISKSILKSVDFAYN